MGSRTPDVDLQGFTERNEYKAAFMEVMQFIYGDKRPVSGPTFELWNNLQVEHRENLKASFNHYLSNFTESEICAMKEMGLIGNVYENP